MMRTAKMDMLRALVSERLSAAAQEIFKIVERTITEYEEEMSCSKWVVDRDRRLMDVSKAHSEGSLQMCATDVKLQAGQQQQPASIEISVCFNPENGPESTGDHPNLSDNHPHSSPASENDDRRDHDILIDVADDGVKQECDMDTHFNTLKMTKPFKCPVCYIGFASKRTMVRHFKKHPEDRYSSYQCQFCPCYFFCKSEFIVHTRTHQGDNPEMYREQMDRLLAHREEHAEEKLNQRLSESDISTAPLNITPYDKSEFDQESLQPLCLYQIQTVTDIDKDSTAAGPVTHIKTEPTECGVSDGATGDSLLLSVNQGENEPKHFNLKNIVEKRASEKSTELVVQFEAGRAQKPHKCPCCSKCFSLSKTLIRHFKIHTHDKAYQCQLCGRKFCQKSDLANHTRIHTGERPYQCPTCHKSFVQKGNLSVHMRKHADEKPSVPRVQLQL
ncbi:gastrula zinc finger protein XlCGF57.1 [Labrus bergylta]|uniref:gastrula zinc finger protein XlCGF57.1 n=1 Tax=Labrus bergylta TaxID=56723 RepID=UPI0009B43DDF|nr:zinc finger protein 184-like [Labrus bergylta]XP_020493849.1 zinc finger protein 184-like [Labrus bergylta]XP_020493857.1 zinc finger protein 184-like [Labrus bergylta]